jgi:hypothetical protein
VFPIFPASQLASKPVKIFVKFSKFQLGLGEKENR